MSNSELAQQAYEKSIQIFENAKKSNVSSSVLSQLQQKVQDSQSKLQPSEKQAQPQSHPLGTELSTLPNFNNIVLACSNTNNIQECVDSLNKLSPGEMKDFAALFLSKIPADYKPAITQLLSQKAQTNQLLTNFENALSTNLNIKQTAVSPTGGNGDSSKSSGWSMWWIIGLILLAILAAGVAWWYFVKNKKEGGEKGHSSRESGEYLE